MRAVLTIITENCKNQKISGYLQSLYQEKTFCFPGRTPAYRGSYETAGEVPVSEAEWKYSA